jgi:hypothetical protein
MPRKELCNANGVCASGRRSVTAATHPGAWPAGMLTGQELVTPKQQLKYCSCGGNHTANCRGCSKWKEAKTAAAKRALRERGRRDGVSTRVPAPKSALPKATPEREALATGWNLIVRGGRILKTHDTSPTMPTNSGLGRQSEHQATH